MVTEKHLGASELRGNKLFESNRCWRVSSCQFSHKGNAGGLNPIEQLAQLASAGRKRSRRIHRLSCVTRSDDRSGSVPLVTKTENRIDIFAASHDSEAINCFGMKFRRCTSSPK
jgi:hypothetical protein